MGFELETPEQEAMAQSGGNFLSTPGIYHANVTQTYEGLAPPKNDGKQKPIEGFSVALDILDGTVPGQKGKTINLTFFNGKRDSKDGGAFSRKKQAAFAIATNLITPEQLGKKVNIDLKNAVSQQVVLKLEKDEQNSEGDKTYLQLSYADIWHVDDPRCESIPKLKAAIDLIPKEARRDKAFFAPLLAGNEKKSTNGSSSTSSTSAASAKKPAFDPDNL